MEKENLKYIPVMFQKIQEYSDENIDTRFLKVKIFLMHLGKNLNGSVFDKDSVELAIPSLANTPILCFIEETEDGEKDFSDHRMVLVKEDGKFKYKYIGNSIGVIPETNNAHFEERLCDDGITREFLVVDGLIWTKWDDPIDIFNKNNIKSQSMELHEEYTGEYDKDGYFHFNSFSFFGACILGDSVSPAMVNSTVELQQFSINSVFENINEKMELYKTNFVKQKGGDDKVNREEILSKFSHLSGEEFDIIISNSELSDEELENKLFTLSVNQIRQAINVQLEKITTIYTYWDGDSEEIPKYWLADIITSENLAITEDNINYGVYFAIPYEMNGDVAVLNEEAKVRYVRGDWRPMEGVEPTINPMYSHIKEMYQEKLNKDVAKKEEEIKNSFNVKETEEYKNLEKDFNLKVEELNSKTEEFNNISKDIESYTSKISSLESESEILKKFQLDKLHEEKIREINEIVSKFSVEGIDIESVKSDALEEKITMEQLEEKLFAMVGKKHFTEQIVKGEINEETLKFSLKSTETCPYPSLAQYFTK